MENNGAQPETIVMNTAAQTEHAQRGNTAMVLSIIGLAIFFLPIANIAGFVLAIIGFVKSRDNRKFAAENGIPECNANTAGYICGLIGIILGGIGVLVTVMLIAAVCGFITLAATTATMVDIPSIVNEAIPAITSAPLV